MAVVGRVKHVFIETNYLVEVARPLPRNREAPRLLERCRRGELELHVPWCAITETRRTLERIIHEDLGFDTQAVRFAAKALLANRARFSEQQKQTIEDFAQIVRTDRRLAIDSVDATVDGVVAIMDIIPPSPAVVARTLRIWNVKKLPPFDEMVMGAVLARAAELHAAGEREMYFCNLNKSDFSPFSADGLVSRPELEAEYAACGLRYLPSFEVP